MDFKQAIESGFRNYINFNGRASRSEFWYWILFGIVVGVFASVVDSIMFGPGNGPVNMLISLALFLPGLAVTVRRLHDVNRSGWWFLIAFTIIGIFVLLYWECIKGTDGPNEYGPDSVPAY